MDYGLLIALLALVTTILNAYNGRRHNRLSVKPILRFDRRKGSGNVRLLFKNCGIGPAIIKTVDIKYKKISIDGTKNLWLFSLWKFIKEEYEVETKNMELQNIKSSTIKLGDTYSANDEEIIIEFKSDNVDLLNWVYIKIVNELEVNITYKSIYNENYSVHIPKIDFIINPPL